MKHTGALLQILSILALSACTRSVSLTVLQPAAFKVPDHIAKVAMVDRSKPSNGWLNVLEGVFTGEAIGQDRQSRSKAVEGLTDALERTPRFKVIRTGIEMAGSKAGNNLPEPLPWSEIEKLCADYAADAIVTIESFDSDNSVTAVREESRRKDKEGNVKVIVQYRADLRANVRMGWRLYDPKTRVILDEFVTDDFLTRTATGADERASRANLPSPVSVTRDVAFIGGQHYGMRIAPVYVQVNRNYYAKAKGYKTQMEQAARYASAGNWDQAATLWKQIEARSKDLPKTAGKAAYNMAVAAEVDGRLDLAIEWAENAWNKYGNKKARTYLYSLRQRQRDAQTVEYQMNKKVTP